MARKPKGLKKIKIGPEDVKISSNNQLSETVVNEYKAGSIVEVKGTTKTNSPQKVSNKDAKWLILYGYAKEVKE